MIKKILLLSSLLTSYALADTTTLNNDKTEYEAPRLAGDSLAIKPLDIDNESEADSIKEMFIKGKIKGLLRYGAQYRDTSYTSTQSGVPSNPNTVKQYSALGGYLGYETAEIHGFSMGATFYTAQKFGPNPDDGIGLGGLNEEGTSAHSYTILGEAYLKYENAENDLRVGRREMPNYRFVSLSNVRFTPITHEGVTYENSSLGDVKIILANINKQKNRNSTEFIGMIRASRVCEDDIEGSYDPSNFVDGLYAAEVKSMLMGSVTLSQENRSLEVWNYYVEDFINILYLYGDYDFKVDKDLSLSAAFQYANQFNVGSSVAGNIDSWFYGLKLQADFKNGITLFGAYNEVAYNENAYDGGTILVRWGTPQMFNSYQVQDSELAGTKSLGIGLQIELGHMNIVPNTVIRFRYANYDLPDSLNQKYVAQDRAETTFDLRYSFRKNDGFGIFTQMNGLSVQFRIAYDDYKTDYDYESYHGYKFDEVTKDFFDTRLYIDYIF